MKVTDELIMFVISNPTWYDYDFSIPLKFLWHTSSTEEGYGFIGEQITTLQSAGVPPQAIIQSVMALLKAKA